MNTNQFHPCSWTWPYWHSHFESIGKSRSSGCHKEGIQVSGTLEGKLTVITGNNKGDRMRRMDQRPNEPKRSGAVEHYDAVVIGAGFAGLYALSQLIRFGTLPAST